MNQVSHTVFAISIYRLERKFGSRAKRIDLGRRYGTMKWVLDGTVVAEKSYHNGTKKPIYLIDHHHIRRTV